MAEWDWLVAIGIDLDRASETNNDNLYSTMSATTVSASLFPPVEGYRWRNSSLGTTYGFYSPAQIEDAEYIVLGDRKVILPTVSKPPSIGFIFENITADVLKAGQMPGVPAPGQVVGQIIVAFDVISVGLVAGTFVSGPPTVTVGYFNEEWRPTPPESTQTLTGLDGTQAGIILGAGSDGVGDPAAYTLRLVTELVLPPWRGAHLPSTGES